MYDVYEKWLKSEQPGARPNIIVTGSGTVSAFLLEIFTALKSCRHYI